MTSQERSEALETLLDEYGDPADLLDALSTIASEKADHVRTNWQDDARADCWERWSNRIAGIAHQTAKKFGNPHA